jgi:hypothetical protein
MTTIKPVFAIDFRNASEVKKEIFNNILIKNNAFRIEAGKRHTITDKANTLWNDQHEVIGLEVSSEWQVKTVRKASKLDAPKAGITAYTVASFVETL